MNVVMGSTGTRLMAVVSGRARGVLALCALALCIPHSAQAGPLIELTGGGLGSGGFNARAIGASAASAYFNPALLALADPGFDFGIFSLSDQIEIRPYDRPDGADVPEGARFYALPDGGALSPVPAPTVWLQEGIEQEGIRRAPHPRQDEASSPQTRAYATVGLVNRVFEQSLVLGLYAMIPLGGFTATSSFYNDEREQFFGNSLHPELYSDRLAAAELAFGVASRVYQRLSLGLSFTLNLKNEAYTPTYVSDASRLNETAIDSRIEVTTAVSPHFGVAFEALPDLHLTATVHTPQSMEIVTDVTYMLNSGQQQGSTFTFVHGYLPWSAALGASFDLMKPPESERGGHRLSAVGTLKFCDWSEYRDRHGESPRGRYRWKQTLTPSAGLRYGWHGWDGLLDLTYVPSPVPAQTGRGNYVDNDRIGIYSGVEYRFELFSAEMSAGLNLQFHYLPSRSQRKSDSTANSGGTAGVDADELVIDEVPDGALDRRQIDPDTGQYQAAAGSQGLQTNNPGWPGFSSEGWLLGGGVRLAVLF